MDARVAWDHAGKTVCVPTRNGGRLCMGCASRTISGCLKALSGRLTDGWRRRQESAVAAAATVRPEAEGLNSTLQRQVLLRADEALCLMQYSCVGHLLPGGHSASTFLHAIDSTKLNTRKWLCSCVVEVSIPQYNWTVRYSTLPPRLTQPPKSTWYVVQLPIEVVLHMCRKHRCNYGFGRHRLSNDFNFLASTSKLLCTYASDIRGIQKARRAHQV